MDIAYICTQAASPLARKKNSVSFPAVFLFNKRLLVCVIEFLFNRVILYLGQSDLRHH